MISFIVPAHNEELWIGKCLDSIRTTMEKLAEPYEVIVAVPVAPPGRLEVIRSLCDQLICLLSPEEFYAVGQFYRSFDTVEDEEVVRILREFAPGNEATLQRLAWRPEPDEYARLRHPG